MTPRFPVSFSHDKNKGKRYFLPIRLGVKLKVDAVDDDVTHEVASALREVSERGGSPQVSPTPNRKAEMPSPFLNSERMNAESEATSAKIHGSECDEDACELSLGRTEDKYYSSNIEDTGIDEVQQKGKRYCRRKPEVEESVNIHLEDTKDAKTSRASKGPSKRSKKVLFGGVEETSFDVLQTLADLSLMMTETASDTEGWATTFAILPIGLGRDVALVNISSTSSSSVGEHLLEEGLVLSPTTDFNDVTAVMDNQGLWRDLAHCEKAKGKCLLETGKNDPQARQVIVPLPRIVIGNRGSRRSNIYPPVS